MNPSRLLPAFFVWAALSSCAQTAPVPPALPASTPTAPPSRALANRTGDESEAESARLSRELRALIGPATCTADSQCRSLPIGAKACGGPAGYLAWSTEGTDAQRVTELATRQSTAQQREIVASGMRSNCAIAADPGAACVAGRCQLAAPASAR